MTPRNNVRSASRSAETQNTAMRACFNRHPTRSIGPVATQHETPSIPEIPASAELRDLTEIAHSVIL